MKRSAFVLGLISFLSPVPFAVATILWDWVLSFGIGMGLLGYDHIPDWILFAGLAPLLISPTLGIVGIVYGFCERKEKLAWLGILLSVLGVMVNGLLLFAMGYAGSHY